MNLGSILATFQTSEYAGIPLVGFTHAEEEGIRSILSRIPRSILKNVKVIRKENLTPKHGRFDPEVKRIAYDPRILHHDSKFGRGQGRKLGQGELTLAHEVGHALFLSLPPKMQREWRKLSGWKTGTGKNQADAYQERRPGWPKMTSKETHSKDAKFTRHYAERNSGEDFADAFAFTILGFPQQVPEPKLAFLEKVIQ